MSNLADIYALRLFNCRQIGQQGCIAHDYKPEQDILTSLPI